VIAIIILIAGVFVFLYRRKRRTDQGHIEGQDTKTRPFDGSDSSSKFPPSAAGDISAPVFVAFSRRGSDFSPTMDDDHACSEKCQCGGRYENRQQHNSLEPSPIASSFAMRHPSVSASSVGRSSIVSRNRILPASPRPPGRRSTQSSSSKPGGGASRLALVDGDSDIIIQHRDGGLVQELPPPYMLPRVGQASSSDSSHPLPVPPPLRDVKQPFVDDSDPAPEFEAGPSS